MSRSRPCKSPSRKSAAELALNDLCVQLGYCIPPEEQEAILANPPANAEAFVDAVLVAEGRNPVVLTRAERRALLEIVTKRGVYL